MSAINISDLHLTLKPPVSRFDDDWLEAMSKPLREIRKLQKEHGAAVICSGDVFDRWNASAELINFAIRELPIMSGIPGQHDLPYHRYADVKRSAYWTLVESGKIRHLEPGVPFAVNDDVVVWGFPWNCEVITPSQPLIGFNVALIHAYIWSKSASYPGAPEESHFKEWKKRLNGYRVACFGDNHKGFLIESDDMTIHNCGSMMRRKSDEFDYKPAVGLIYNDGSVERHHLDCSSDKLLTKAQVMDTAKSMDFESFINSLQTLDETVSNFVEAVEMELNRREAPPVLREMVMRMMEGHKYD